MAQKCSKILYLYSIYKITDHNLFRCWKYILGIWTGISLVYKMPHRIVKNRQNEFLRNNFHFSIFQIVWKKNCSTESKRNYWVLIGFNNHVWYFNRHFFYSIKHHFNRNLWKIDIEISCMDWEWNLRLTAAIILYNNRYEVKSRILPTKSNHIVYILREWRRI